MRVLLIFASTEGHTAKLGRFVAAQLREDGHEVVSQSAEAPDDISPKAFGRVLLMGSLHAGEYQPDLIAWARRHAGELDGPDAAFVSVSLSAAGHDHRDWQGLELCLRRFQGKTGWTPRTVLQAAGAFSFTRYGFLTRFIMGRIAHRRGLQVDARHDLDLTDYAALAGFVRDFVGGASQSYLQRAV